MKREDITILIRAAAIGLFALFVLACSSLLLAFVLHARRVYAELLS